MWSIHQKILRSVRDCKLKHQYIWSKCILSLHNVWYKLSAVKKCDKACKTRILTVYIDINCSGIDKTDLWGPLIMYFNKSQSNPHYVENAVFSNRHQQHVTLIPTIYKPYRILPLILLHTSIKFPIQTSQTDRTCPGRLRV